MSLRDSAQVFPFPVPIGWSVSVIAAFSGQLYFLRFSVSLKWFEKNDDSTSSTLACLGYYCEKRSTIKIVI